MVLDRRFCSLLLLLVSMLFVMATRADAQNALWNLALTNASQTVSSGTSGLVVYDGNISNTDSSNTFNLIGDSITTTNWHSSLSVVEDPLFMNFLNNVGSIPPGSTYTGAIIDVIYTSATPATLSGTPYTGSIDITTDGIPTDLTSNFALAVSGAPPVPESSSFAGLCALLLLSGLLLGLMRRYSARGNSGGGTVWLCAAVLCVACAHAATAGGVTGTINDVDYLKAQPGGYQGTSYPRWQDAAGNDLGQLVYPQDQDLSLCMVMDTNTGTLVSAGTPYGGGNGGNAMFSFAYLPAGTHKLELIEPFRDEYFQPISKIVTVNVPRSGTATATFNVVRNWQFSVIDKFPTGITGRTFFGGMSTDFVNNEDGWCALEQDVTQFDGNQDVFIYRTTNGGASWQKSTTIQTPYINDELLNDSFSPLEYGLHFTDAQNGVLIGEESTSAIVGGYTHLSTFFTSDGGTTWKRLSTTISLTGYDSGTDGVYPVISLGWDPANPKNGTIFGSLGGYFDPKTGTNYGTYTLTTNDGGHTWTYGNSYAEAYDLYYFFFQRLFVFGGNTFSTMTPGGVAGFRNSGALLTSLLSGWVPFVDGNSNGLNTDPHSPYVVDTAYGTDAAQKMDAPDGPHLYQTTDSGNTWNQVMHPLELPTSVFITGSNLSFQAQEVGTVPGGEWMWDPDENGGPLGSQIGRSIDSLISRSFMGYCISFFPEGSIEQAGATQEDASSDINHGRKVFMLDPGFNKSGGTNWLLSFNFNDPQVGIAQVVPKCYESSTGDFGNTKLLVIQFVNKGTKSASNVTIDSITSNHGVTFQAAFPLNIGAIPPLSSTDIPLGSYTTYTPPCYIVENNLPTSGTRYSITVTGTYGNGQVFRQTLFTRA